MAAVPALGRSPASLILHPYSEVQAKETSNKNNNYHDADDVKNIHCVLRLS
jgi:hypothetical protein